MRFEVYNPANGIALLQTRTRAGAWAAVRRLNPVTPLNVRPLA